MVFNATDLFNNEPNRLLNNIDELDDWRLFMNPPEYQYYINVGQTQWEDTTEIVELNYDFPVSWDVSPLYDIDQWFNWWWNNVNDWIEPIAHFDWFEATRDTTTAQFCELMAPWSTFVSYTSEPIQDWLVVHFFSANNSVWREWSNNNNTAQWYRFTDITCQIETTIPFEPQDITVVNNKQLYHQLYDIKMILLFMFLLMLTKFAYNLLKSFYNSKIVRTNDKLNY